MSDTTNYCIYCGYPLDDEDITYCSKRCHDNDEAELQDELKFQNAVYYM